MTQRGLADAGVVKGNPTSPIVIGDLQGCLDCLLRLLDEIAEHENPATPTPLWLTGDLINRGPQSLETLRWAYQHRERITTVLGNHDLHLLAVACGIRPAHVSDTLDEILAAPDLDTLLDWLRTRPLAHRWTGADGRQVLMVHAGVLPQWTPQQVIDLAAEVQHELAGPNWKTFLRTMYGNDPRAWDDDLRGADRHRVIINALTRMRFCTPTGVMNFSAKEGPGLAPVGLLPWFDVPGRATAHATVVFGHWSTLGLLDRPDVLGVDTGCVWGGALTGVRLGDRQQFQIACPQTLAPGD